MGLDPVMLGTIYVQQSSPPKIEQSKIPSFAWKIHEEHILEMISCWSKRYSQIRGCKAFLPGTIAEMKIKTPPFLGELRIGA